jgi:HD-like signal output (HDOD) protein
MSETVVNKELEKAIMTAADLPTIPVVAIKVMKLIESEKATAEELAKIVASDPAVAARVLKISNSSFYGCKRQIQTLSSAIMILGFSTLRSLVVAASVKQAVRPHREDALGAFLRRGTRRQNHSQPDQGGKRRGSLPGRSFP